MDTTVKRIDGNGKTELAEKDTLPRQKYQLLGESEVMCQFREQLRRVAQTNVTVLLQGESGTGKEVAARLLRQWSRRRQSSFVVVNCSGLAEGVLESELFGHELGAFSGAQRLRRGAFEMGQGGTVFLDEVGTASPGMQLRLLRVIESKEVQRVGGNRAISTDVRLVAASNQPLAERVRQGLFREDLYHRLNVVELSLPPLRERVSDIPVLTGAFLKEAAEQNGLERIPLLPAETLSALTRYPWPGNVRQLKHVMERAVVLDRDGVIGLDDLPAVILEARPLIEGREVTIMVPEHSSLWEGVACFEQSFILKTLAQCRGNITIAARVLGMSRKNLYVKLEQFGIDVEACRVRR